MTENRERPRAPSFVRPTFEHLYTSVGVWLPKALRRLGVACVDAEDLVHDVVTIAHRQLDHFDPSAVRRRGDPARALQAWVYGIAWRQVTKRNKTASRRDRVAYGSREAPSPEELAAAGEPSTEGLRSSHPASLVTARGGAS